MKASKAKRALLAVVAVFALFAAALFRLPTPAEADSASENMQVDVSVTGNPNGPYNITITAKQLTANDPQWGDETTLYYRANNIVKLPAASAITASDNSVEITRSNDYELTVKGYDYSAHVGQPLTISITGATLNTDSLTLDSVNGAANLDLLSSSQTYIWRNGHDYHFTNDGMPKVSVVWYGGSGPKPMWNGKKASWSAADSATSYDVQLIGPGNTKLVDMNTTALEYDFSNNITEEGRYRVNVWAKYGTDVKSQLPGYTDKTWYEVKVQPAFKNVGESNYEAGTTGGTVAGTATSGDTFTAGSDGAISGLFAVGDKIKITPTAATGYTFEKFANYYDGSNYVQKTDNPLEFTLASPQPGLTAFFVQDEPDPVTVILEVGEGHEALAKKISDAAEEAGYEPTLSGTTLTMAKFPVLDKYGDAVTVKSGANDIIDDLLLTAFSGGFSRWRDNGEQLFDTALNTIENYDSEEAIYEELNAATDAIANNQKYYLLWAEPVSKVDLTIEKPICGTKVIQNEDVFENGPVVTASDDSDVVIGRFANFWVAGDGMTPIAEMDIKGGEDYTALEVLRPKFGFFIDENNLPEVTVTNAKSTGLGDLDLGVITITVTADHDLGEWEPKEGDPTKEVQKCKHCGEVINERDLITVTLIPSTMDGSEIGDPIVLTIPKGESLDSYTATVGRYKALVEQLKNMNEEYYPYSGNVYVTDKPYSEYSSEDDVDDADDEFFYKALTENTTFYVPMDKFIEELDVTVERPMAGTQVDVQTDDGHVQDGAKGLPTTTISDDKLATHYDLPYWVTDDITGVDYDKPFNGTIQAREDYKVLIQLEPKLGWAFKYLYDPAYVTINGKAVDTVLFSAHYYHDILGTVPSDFTYNLYVGGVHVTDSNKDDVLGDGTVKFDPENVKLTLNNADIEVSRREDSDDGNEYGIRSNLGDGMAEFRGKPLTIELIGTNTISDGTDDEGTAEKYGIFVASSGTVTYTGGGTLNVTMNDANTAERYLGLQHHQSITVDGVDINIDIDGTADHTEGIYMLYTNTLSLKNGSNVRVNVTSGYAFDNNRQGNKDLDVAEGCVFEAASKGPNGALHGNGWVELTDATKELGAYVNAEPTSEGRSEWDGTTNLSTYKYVRIPGPIKLTLKWSSIDGETPVEDFELLLEPGQAFINADPDVYNAAVDHFQADGYAPLGFFTLALTPDPITAYSSIQEVSDADLSDAALNEDTTLYVLMLKEIDGVEAAVEAPAGGSSTTTGKDEEGEWSYATQTNPPKASSNGENYAISELDGTTMAFWIKPTGEGDDFEPFIGTFKGGEDYTAMLLFEAQFGYTFKADAKATVNGEDASVLSDLRAFGYLIVSAPVTAESDDEFFVLTFKLEGGTMDGKTTVVYKGYKEGVTITMPLPTREGYRFLYWEGSKYYAGQEYTITEDHTFTAVWEKLPTPTPKTGSKVPSTGDPTTLAWLGVMAAGAASTLLSRAARRRED